MSRYTWLRIILFIWLIAFPVVACGPLLLSEQDVAVALSALFGLVVFWLLFVPWLIGLVILGIAVYITSPGRRG
ncbi:MAG TPA: hypothetical protein VNW68_02260 [Candidatus Limnocylindria bacterium]|nr:hypothetical protein [Candidatus Limnocylindria bacterium]